MRNWCWFRVLIPFVTGGEKKRKRDDGTLTMEAQIGFPLLFAESHSAGDSNPGLKHARLALSQMGYTVCTGVAPQRTTHDLVMT